MEYTIEEIVQYLQEEKDHILTEWYSKHSIFEKEGQDINFRQNSEALYEIIINSLYHSGRSNIDSIKALARSAAESSYKAGSDFNNFIYDISAGRTIILSRLISAEINFFQQEGILKILNECFDSYILHAVSHFSTMNTETLQKKYYLLNQTHKDRLTLLGQMTSSFVHEFRNPLTSIMGFIQLLQSENKEIKYLDIISKELEQLNYRVTQFLSLSKKENSENERKTFSIRELVNEVIDFLYPTILEVNAAITCNIPEDIYIKGSKEEFRQVLLNIVLNATDVISSVPAPAIYINAAEKPSGYMTLSLANNGPKIPNDIIPTIFEPFITTKKRGTGLGLFVCKEIIEKHGGTLSCKSTDDITTFSIFMPCCEGD
ncbi:histidine kinase N-terminal domain-containing protein [Peribacillus sp. SCS-155]|uniref:histidine kinase N-terminal domain-containing protein n=1 Tax=Peribacillus sedimenti TaxID=3115297 RepID=UPI0039066259